MSVREFEETVINGTDWNNVIAGGLQSFHEKNMYHIDEMASLKEVSTKEQRLMLKPWITKDILDRCNRSDGLRNEMRKESDPIKTQGKVFTNTFVKKNVKVNEILTP